jgi:hypothetical protein
VTTTTECQDHTLPCAGPKVTRATVARFERAYRKFQIDLWNATLWYGAVKNAETVKSKVRTWHVSHPSRVTVSATPTGSVAECVKRHESGNYSESSHVNSGSGAYQYVPTTWQTWSQRAGYGGYRYAYQAPPAVQDAVFEFTIHNGGAHNWDSSYGNDPCTESMP